VAEASAAGFRVPEPLRTGSGFPDEASDLRRESNDCPIPFFFSDYWQAVTSTTQMGWPEPLALPQHATFVPWPANAEQTEVQGQVLQPVAGRYRSQFPFTQTSLTAQTVWQSPQCSGSVFWSTQATRLFTVHASGVGALHAP
jgi:hypothetical protein